MPRYSPPLAWWYLKKQRQRRQAGPIPPPPFDPSILFSNGEQGGLYDPSDLTTLFQDAAGTVPVTADGDPVGLVLDKSGNGNHLVQSATASRPTYRTDGTLRWLESDGVDDYMSSNAVNMQGSDKATIIVGQYSISSTGIVCEYGTNVNTIDGSFSVFKNSSSLQYTARGTSTPAFLNTQNTQPSVLFARTGFNIPERFGRLNGVQRFDSSASMGGGAFGNHALYIMRRGLNNFPWAGRLYGLVVVNRRIIDTDVIGDIETWMAEKTGITL